ncbi:envelope glycoprotein K [Canid alphaherpesvirus 1]|uniref:Envelope glycoprotein K n=1 Tax=Canid alphaherpesvirus 1 TaxID=170325 RepID=A0A172ER54_9ALPH|nr:envelope glycoprotein K [Canid alphaherpesvirus 1]ALL25882.1 envelope glycoprotein K [Canid alphaherpesvirus 1]ALL25962.1 envelope glycoprotein K [Canid alphaherpesvirus 1]ALL26038.1 envelope glycoprotein K [Canid alphaherpesvirus 1]ARE29810.1 envelope glycoprotein K [Canid alphaherpesvirus 1]QQL08528.1 envelope glycoprotein K [Canid alphaherpesvirus 1]
MLFGGKLSHITILVIITAYSIFTLWYSMHTNTINKCVYATIPLDHQSYYNYSWSVHNTSLIYALANNGDFSKTDGLSGYDYICRKDLAMEIKIRNIEDINVRKRVRIVFGTRNCQAYIWCVQLKLITITWLLYIAFIYMRQERRMFGPFRDYSEFIIPSGYTLNYTTRVISKTILNCYYTKFARLLCEVSMQRQSLSSSFKEDPISFLFKNKYIGILIMIETVIHLIARIILMGTIGLIYTPCAQTYPLYVKIMSCMFVFIVFTIEIVSMFYKKSNKNKTEANTRSESRGIFTNCCSTLLAGLLSKLFYILIIIGAVIILLHYEQRIQINLFGENTN